jgi:hypothetical protein
MLAAPWLVFLVTELHLLPTFGEDVLSAIVLLANAPVLLLVGPPIDYFGQSPGSLRAVAGSAGAWMVWYLIVRLLGCRARANQPVSLHIEEN